MCASEMASTLKVGTGSRKGKVLMSEGEKDSINSSELCIAIRKIQMRNISDIKKSVTGIDHYVFSMHILREIIYCNVQTIY